MGKLVRYLLILIFVDMLFLLTGQICASGTCTLTSILFNAILNIGNNATLTQFFTTLMGDILNFTSSATGILSLVVGGAVIVAALAATRDIKILLVATAFALSLIVSDFIVIFRYLFDLNAILATLVMVPLSVIYILTVFEWWNSRD